MEEESETKIWRQVFKKQIKLKMDRYMERTEGDPERVKNPKWRPESERTGGRDGDVASKTEYITRLTSLRDSLIDQEELNLAQALERLRLHSLTNKSHSNRLRMNTNDDLLSAQSLISQRRNMISTVERFRQIRPRRQKPVIFPLQGRQMLDVPRPASEEPISNFGNATNRSDKSSHLGTLSSRAAHAKVDETVQSNLQRLIQRTSSIPNIGRKALKQQEDLEPKAKPLLNIRAKLQKQPGSHLATPFLFNTHDPTDTENPLHRNSADPDIPNLSPQAHKLGPVLQGDMIDMDVLQQYYQSYLDSGAHGEGNNSSDRRDMKHLSSSTHSPFLQKLNYRHSPLVKSNGINMRSFHSNVCPSPVTHYNSFVSSTGRVISLSDLPDIMPRTTYTYYSTATPQSSTVNGDGFDNDKLGRFPELQTSYRYHMGPSDASSTTSGVSKSWLRSVHRRKHNNSPVDEESEGYNKNEEEGRMKIVVDMPNIIFNAASPEGDGSVDQGQSQGHSQGQGQGHTTRQPATVLRKAMKQQEIRKKELNNLLEDVKELNKMSEVLSGSSVAHGT